MIPNNPLTPSWCACRTSSSTAALHRNLSVSVALSQLVFMFGIDRYDNPVSCLSFLSVSVSQLDFMFDIDRYDNPVSCLSVLSVSVSVSQLVFMFGIGRYDESPPPVCVSVLQLVFSKD